MPRSGPDAPREIAHPDGERACGERDHPRPAAGQRRPDGHKPERHRDHREEHTERSPLHRGKWLTFLVVCVCLAISATYELIEWLAAVLGGSAADAFLGTQGDVWDTQWDMFMALVGALSALLLLSRVHDRQLDRLSTR